MKFLNEAVEEFIIHDYLIKALTNKLTKSDKSAAVNYVTNVLMIERAKRVKLVGRLKRELLSQFKKARK